MRRNWHMLRDDTGLTLCRHLPPRFDFMVCTVLPGGRAERLAHQIRQDLWRALQRVRGFSPVVRLSSLGDDWKIEAGGRTSGPVPASVIACAGAVLDNPDNRSRWLRNAGARI